MGWVNIGTPAPLGRKGAAVDRAAPLDGRVLRLDALTRAVGLGPVYQPNRAIGGPIPASSAHTPHRSMRRAPGRSEAATRRQP